MSDYIVVNGFCFSLFVFLFLSIAYYVDLSHLASVREETEDPSKNNLEDHRQAR